MLKVALNGNCQCNISAPTFEPSVHPEEELEKGVSGYNEFIRRIFKREKCRSTFAFSF